MQSKPDHANLLAQLDAQRDSQGLDGRHGFAIARQYPGAHCTTVSRAGHTFKGVRVFQSESVIVSGPDGSVVSESVADRRSGLAQGDMSVIPALSAKAAIDSVVRDMDKRAVPVEAPSAELIIYPVMKTVRVAAAAGKADADLNAVDLEDVVDGYELAYLVRTRMATGTTAVYFDSIVSARDGSLLAQWSMVQTAGGGVTSPITD